MRKLNLTGKRGGYAKVDDSDYLHLLPFKWNHLKCGYAARYENGKMIYLHRQICGSPNTEVDHINGDKLDCRKENLRICDRRTNATNSGKRYPRGRYGRNVVKMSGDRKKPYLVRCWHYNKAIYGPYFEKLADAQKYAEELRKKLNYVE